MRGLQDVDLVNHARVHQRDGEFDLRASDEKFKIFFALRLGELLGIVQAGEFGGQNLFPAQRDGKMASAAATTSDPANGPRPASSTPAMRAMPDCQSGSSNSKRFMNLAVMALEITALDICEHNSAKIA